VGVCSFDAGCAIAPGALLDMFYSLRIPSRVGFLPIGIKNLVDEFVVHAVIEPV
jgi:hypothetical protein